MTDPLSTLLHATAERVPAALHPGAELRDNAQRHQRVRRAGTAATAVVTLLLVGTIAVTTQGGGDRKAAPPPADERPPLSSTSLLIAEELEPQYTPVPNVWRVAETGEAEPATPVTSCQQGSLSDLGATRVWHRSFTDERAIHEAAQVTAEFASPEEAGKALAAVDRWFDTCSGLKQPVWRYPVVKAAESEVRAATVLREAGDEGDEWSSTRYESVSYAISGSALTLVASSTERPDDGPPRQSPKMEAPFRETMDFAVRRLAGSRTTSESAVPATFVFAEDRVSPDGVVRMNGESRSYLGDGWRPGFCFRLLPWRDVEAHRSGMVNSGTLSTGGPAYTSLQLQLASYDSEDNAKEAAEEVQSGIVACGSRSVTAVHTVQSPAGSHDVYVMVDERSDGYTVEAGARAVTVVRLGNAVLLASAQAPRTADTTDADMAELAPAALELVKTTLQNNLDRVCEIASGCG